MQNINCQIIYGTYKAGENAINLALKFGFKNFDSASHYGNADIIYNAIKNNNITRNEINITSKIWKDEVGYKKTQEACKKILESLHMDYIDTLLIHWPDKNNNLNLETWNALENLKISGLVKNIGLSNFLPHHADIILKNCKIKPSVVQLEFHPGYTQFPAVKYFQDNNIQVQAWSPLARGRIFNDELITGLAKKYNVTLAQICLNFCKRENIIPIVKASDSEHFDEILNAFKFEIEQNDLWKLETMPQTGWSGEHPDRERVKI